MKKINSHSDFRLMLFGSDDKFEILDKTPSGSDPAISGDLGDHTSFWRVQARYRNKISEDTQVRIVGAFGADILNFNLGDDYLRVHSNPASLRAELSQRIGPHVVANFGLDLQAGGYDVDVHLPPLPTPGQPPAGPGLAQSPLTSASSGFNNRPGVYTEFELTPFKGTRIVPGFRADYANDTDKWDMAPRVSARQDLHSDFPRTTLKGGVGVFAQPPQFQETDKVFGQLGLRSERAIHYDVGFEQEITRPVELSVDTFYKQLDDLVVQGAGNGGTGRVYGLETLLKWKPDQRFFGWISYTLSRSTRDDGPGTPQTTFQYDQTHIFVALGSYRLGRGWEIGGRFRLVSGNPYTPERLRLLRRERRRQPRAARLPAVQPALARSSTSSTSGSTRSGPSLTGGCRRTSMYRTCTTRPTSRPSATITTTRGPARPPGCPSCRCSASGGSCR